LTQDELAELAGISRSKLIRLERSFAYTDMRVADLAQLAIALGCDPIDLLEDGWMRWTNTKIKKEAISGHWRDDTVPPTPAVSQTKARRELRRLLKDLPERIKPHGGRSVAPAAATPHQLRGVAHDEEIAAILEPDSKEASARRRCAELLLRAAELRELES
jgi:transcriptional regulator with XRE-family HTH domain